MRVRSPGLGNAVAKPSMEYVIGNTGAEPVVWDVIIVTVAKPGTGDVINDLKFGAYSAMRVRSLERGM